MEGKGEIIIYQSDNGKNQLEVKLQNQTVWLNQYQMADLFQTDRTSIQKHIQNIYKTKELSQKATCANFAQVQKEGEAKINDNALVALALLIAQSDPANKELMIKLVINLINE